MCIRAFWVLKWPVHFRSQMAIDRKVTTFVTIITSFTHSLSLSSSITVNSLWPIENRFQYLPLGSIWLSRNALFDLWPSKVLSKRFKCLRAIMLNEHYLILSDVWLHFITYRDRRIIQPIFAISKTLSEAIDLNKYTIESWFNCSYHWLPRRHTIESIVSDTRRQVRIKLKYQPAFRLRQ